MRRSDIESEAIVEEMLEASDAEGGDELGLETTDGEEGDTDEGSDTDVDEGSDTDESEAAVDEILQNNWDQEREFKLGSRVNECNLIVEQRFSP